MFGFIVGAFSLIAQQNFSYAPSSPKAGDVITITYSPAGDLANTLKKVEAAVYLTGKDLPAGIKILVR